MLKAPIFTTAADDRLIYVSGKNSLDISAAENSHETPILVFFENNWKKKMSSATNFAWRFKG